MFDPSIRRWKREHKDRPAGLATPELKERTEFSWDEVVCNGGAIGHVLGISLAPELEDLICLCTQGSHLGAARDQMGELMVRIKALDVCVCVQAITTTTMH